MAEGTRKNLRIQWESFVLFCLYFGMAYLPTDTYTMQLYAQFLSRTFKSASSIKNYLSGVRTIHLLLGYQLLDINNYLINFSVRGITRLKSHCVKQAEPITPRILHQIFLVLNMQDYDDMVYWCLFLFAFFLVARKSNLVPTTLSDIANNKCLFHRNVLHCKDYLLVTMNWSKVIQFGERKLETPLLRLSGSCLCPVTAYERMIQDFNPCPDDPLFVLKNGKAVSYSKFQMKLRSTLDKIGLDSSKFSSHSFRRGFPTFTFRNNISADEIQILGDWHSDIYKRYISLSVQDKMDIIQSLRSQLYF